MQEESCPVGEVQGRSAPHPHPSGNRHLQARPRARPSGKVRALFRLGTTPGCADAPTPSFACLPEAANRRIQGHPLLAGRPPTRADDEPPARSAPIGWRFVAKGVTNFETTRQISWLRLRGLTTKPRASLRRALLFLRQPALAGSEGLPTLASAGARQPLV